MTDTYPRVQLDLVTYVRRIQTAPCFICGIISGADEQRAIVYRDEHAIAFLSRYPTVLGYVLVCPIQHHTNVVTDFSESEYLRLQAVVHRVGRAISATFPTERLYVLSLGSQQGNAHVHWHLAPLPPGVPHGQQQFHALMTETSGYLDIPAEDQAALAKQIAANL